MRHVVNFAVGNKVNARLLIKRVMNGTECAIWEEQCGFIGRAGMDQV